MANVPYNPKQWRKEFTARYLPALQEIVHISNSGLNQLFDDNDYKLTGQYMFCSDLFSMCVQLFKDCFTTTAYGLEEDAIDRAMCWLSMVLTVMRQAYASGKDLKVKRNEKFIQGGIMLKQFLTSLEQEQYRLKKRRLVKPEEAPKEQLRDW